MTFPRGKRFTIIFDAWKRDGTWEEILTALRCRVRQAANRSPNPRVACIDSQSVKTAFGGEEVGTDGGKKVRGRKRHIVVDTLGLLLALVVTSANVDDAKAAQTLFEWMPKTAFPRLETVQADNKYHNYQLQNWLRVPKRPYAVWVVNRPPGERKFMPLGGGENFCLVGTLSTVKERLKHLPESSEAFVQIAAIQHYFRHSIRAESKTPKGSF